MNMAIVSLTRQGTALNIKLCSSLHADGFTLEKYRVGSLKSFCSIHDVVKTIFECYDALIFIGACGIIVRSIAPYVKSKLTDIPVVVCDDLGRYAIPILSGHLGGANELSILVAKTINAVPIITTATDIHGKFAVDIWAKDNNLAIAEPEKIKTVSSAILDGYKVGFYSEFPMDIPKGLSSDGDIGIAVSNRLDVSPFHDTLHLLPKNLVLGIGCKKGVPMDNIETLVCSTLDSLCYSIKSVVKVCTIDLKRNEDGLLQFCKEYSIPIEFFSSGELNVLQGDFSKSAFVESITGVDCVCERSAVLGSVQGRLILKKVSKEGVTLAIAL
jgi:cobalt-precorrin 5A hydrolase